MIVVDASALIAIGDNEPDADALLEALTTNEAVMTNINYVETGIILIGRLRLRSAAQLDRWLGELGVKVRQGEDLALPALQAAYRAQPLAGPEQAAAMRVSTAPEGLRTKETG